MAATVELSEGIRSRYAVPNVQDDEDEDENDVGVGGVFSGGGGIGPGDARVAGLAEAQHVAAADWDPSASGRRRASDSADGRKGGGGGDDDRRRRRLDHRRHQRPPEFRAAAGESDNTSGGAKSTVPDLPDFPHHAHAAYAGWRTPSPASGTATPPVDGFGGGGGFAAVAESSGGGIAVGDGGHHHQQQQHRHHQEHERLSVRRRPQHESDGIEDIGGTHDGVGGGGGRSTTGGDSGHDDASGVGADVVRRRFFSPTTNSNYPQQQQHPHQQHPQHHHPNLSVQETWSSAHTVTSVYCTTQHAPNHHYDKYYPHHHQYQFSHHHFHSSSAWGGGSFHHHPRAALGGGGGVGQDHHHGGQASIFRGRTASVASASGVSLDHSHHSHHSHPSSSGYDHHLRHRHLRPDHTDRTTLPSGSGDGGGIGGADNAAASSDPNEAQPWYRFPFGPLPPFREPRYHHVQFLFSSLFLSTALAFFSAYDAYAHCQIGDASEYMEVLDDDEGGDGDGDGDDGDDDARDDDDAVGGWYAGWVEQKREAQACEDLFRGVVVPACAAASIASVAACGIIAARRRVDRRREMAAAARASAAAAASVAALAAEATVASSATSRGNVDKIAAAHASSCALTSTGERLRAVAGAGSLVDEDDEDDDSFVSASSSSAPPAGIGGGGGGGGGRRDPVRHLRSHRSHLTTCLLLSLLASASLAAWIFGVVQIMLVPEPEGDDSAIFSASAAISKSGDAEWDFQSLGAVNLMGEVGDNANLFYSLWASLAIAIAVAYELAGMTVLQCRSTRRARDAAEALGDCGGADCGHGAADCSGTAAVAAKGCTRRRSYTCNKEQKADSFKAIETVLDWTAERVASEIREARDTWYNSLYKLRLRTGIWVAALVANVVALASAARIWRNVMVPAAQSVSEAAGVDPENLGWGVCALVESEVEVWGDDRFIRAFTGYDDDVEDTASGVVGFHVVSFQPDMCQRTEMTVAIGALSSVLSLCAIIAHSFLRRRAAAIAAGPAPHRHDPPEEHVHRTLCCGNVIPLRAEFGLSVLLSLMLGVNAIFATGVGGPAQMVGNLYYSVWLGFLLSVRIAVGCLEEIFDVHESDGGLDEHDRRALPGAGMVFKETRTRPLNARKEIVTKIVMLSDSYAASDIVTPRGDFVPRADHLPMVGGVHPCGGGGGRPHQLETLTSIDGAVEEEEGDDDEAEKFKDEPMTTGTTDDEGGGGDGDGGEVNSEVELGTKNERSKRLRRWCSVSISSSLCAFSAHDAARNEPDGGADLTREQRYMLLCPAAVAIVTFLLFLMCLHPRTYALVDDFRFGGLMSLLTFGAWFVNLVATMHSESSWAVDAIGNIKMANLYYFAWTSIITAGMQMSSYVKKWLGLKPRSIMIILWFAVVKVCTVVLGAGFHIWHNIHDNCEATRWTSNSGDPGEPISFCRRTAFSILVGIVGVAVGQIVVVCRLVFTRETTVKLMAEMVLSTLLAGFFAFGAAVITGIGGPGQSVGDLYYAMWLSFLLSLGVAKGCFEQLRGRREGRQLEGLKRLASMSSVGASGEERSHHGAAQPGMRASRSPGTSDVPFVRMTD